jgi:hypothetical protein
MESRAGIDKREARLPRSGFVNQVLLGRNMVANV